MNWSKDKHCARVLSLYNHLRQEVPPGDENELGPYILTLAVVNLQVADLFESTIARGVRQGIFGEDAEGNSSIYRGALAVEVLY